MASNPVPWALSFRPHPIHPGMTVIRVLTTVQCLYTNKALGCLKRKHLKSAAFRERGGNLCGDVRAPAPGSSAELLTLTWCQE